MSKYTTLLRYPIEQKLDSLNLVHDEDNWPKIYSYIGLGDYPIYSESHRDVLNNKIIREYYFREIGFETFELFRWYMRKTMFEIMPVYNKLYPAFDSIENPLLTKDMGYDEKWTRDEKINHDDTTNSLSEYNSNSTTDSDNKNVFQDTPMNMLDTEALTSLDYATTVTLDSTHNEASGERNDSNTSNAKRNETGDYEGTKRHDESGFEGNQGEILLTFKNSIVNIDAEIIKDLEDLFMSVW